MTKMENFRIECTSAYEGNMALHSSFFARWEDPKAGRKYHVWYYGMSAKRASADLHSNPLDPEKSRQARGHKLLNLNAKAWDFVRAELNRLVTPEALNAARAVKLAEVQGEEAATRAAEAESYRKAFETEADTLEATGPQWRDVAHDLRNAIRELDEAMLIRLGRAIRTAK